MKDSRKEAPVTSKALTPTGQKGLELRGRCIFGHEQILSYVQLAEAGQIGAAFCDKCGNIIIIRKATSVL